MIGYEKNLWVKLIVFYALYLLLVLVQLLGVEDWVFSGPFNIRDGSIYWSIGITAIFNGVLFFSNAYWLIPSYLTRKKILKYISHLVIIFTLLTFLKFLVNDILMSKFDLPDNLNRLYDFGQSDIRKRDIGAPVLIMHLVILLTSFIYRFSIDWVKNERIKQKLTEEKLQAELDFLKAQINPHILFNTINGIFSLARKNEDHDVADALQRLSGILRYVIYDSRYDFIELKEEINFIKSFIELQKIRFESEELLVNLSIKGRISEHQIAPLLLISFVENAFKYGIDIDGRGVISISIDAGIDSILFIVKNKNHGVKPLEEKHGIGLNNVFRRLEIVYENRFQLETNNSKGVYETKLTIFI